MLRTLLRGHPVVRMYDATMLVLAALVLVAKVARARRAAQAAAVNAEVAALDPRKEVRV